MFGGVVVFKLVPIPSGESWMCLQCGMNLDRHVTAKILVKEGEPGKRGSVATGLCGSHAEVFNAEDLEDFRMAQRKFAELC